MRRPEDVRAAAPRRSTGSAAPDIGVVLKIETSAGFENLPRLLLEGLRRPPLAVMIARGDLAVEVGFERLAELQEEILWLCEACHVPAIWATQVLDTLARTGVPSRAEVTDAAASVAAECVMLNKGPFVDEAVRVLATSCGGWRGTATRSAASSGGCGLDVGSIRRGRARPRTARDREARESRT